MRLCLEALAGEADSTVPFEVVIVDDGSTDATEAEVQLIREHLPFDVQYLRQSNRGPATARNRGVDASKGEVVIFLGDDIIVQRGYLGRIYGAYLTRGGCKEVSIVGYTTYRPDLLTTPFASWVDSESGLQFDYPRDLRSGPSDYAHFYTSNVLVSKEALNEAGGFAPNFTYAAYEDTELGYRLQSNGVKLYFCAEALALHVHTVSVASMARRMRVVANAAGELKRANPELFRRLYPDASRLANPSIARRLARWIFAGPLLLLLQVFDRSIHLAAPGWLYARALHSVKARELARVWKTTALARDVHHARG